MAIISYGLSGLPLKNPSNFLPRPPSGKFPVKTVQIKSKRKRNYSCCRCSKGVEELGYDLYELLGIENTAGHQQIRNAYRWLQKKCHPDVAGDDGHHMAILLNEAYSVLSDPNARYAYDRVRAERMEVEGYTGQPLYSKWLGPAEEDRAIFVDEVKCVGCLKCALVAPKTFAIETCYGRARVIGQWADSEETVNDAIQACPVDCISFVERAQLPALEFLMSKQPRVAVRMNANNSVGARVTNVFAEAERFLEKLRKEKVSKFQESAAQREARMAAAEQIRTSAGWWWHHLVGDRAREYTNHQRASKGAIVPLNWEQKQQFSVPIDSDKINNSSGPYKYQRIHISQELSEAAARRRMGKSPSRSKHSQVATDEDYWVPVTPEKSSVPTKNLDSKRIFTVPPRETYTASSVAEEEKMVMELGESRMEGDWRNMILLWIPLATSVAAGLVVGFGSDGGEAGGLERHLAGPLALKMINSFEMHILQAAAFWYVVGALIASVIVAVASVWKKP
ncbi:hypothetical protein SUGI_0657100 [Cryptomeria japonica]|uniref:chaperone protein dnaJ C76, chloroplastic n=1 Tax=Cryptomeria japonica TaxID=3369 RepID=UPI002414BA91|nr:chaperone protein dnaJ C76, chloroplastic [Cryptomeria japonica]GLJ32659.1 hypothetical protein SUGI_0657100 [Cryptomeria japonica]